MDYEVLRHREIRKLLKTARVQAHVKGLVTKYEEYYLAILNSRLPLTRREIVELAQGPAEDPTNFSKALPVLNDRLRALSHRFGLPHGESICIDTLGMRGNSKLWGFTIPAADIPQVRAIVRGILNRLPHPDACASLGEESACPLNRQASGIEGFSFQAVKKHFSIELERHQDLVPRPTWQKQLDAFLAEKERHRYLLYEAEAGLGKTAFIAAQIDRNPRAIFYIVKRDQSWDQPHDIVASVTRQLLERFGVPAPSELSASPPDELKALRSTLQHLSELREQPVIFVDGLDEAYGPTARHARESLGDLLPSRLPEGVRFVLTSRPGPHVDAIAGYEQLQTADLDPTCDGALQEIRDYLWKRSERMNTPLTDQLVETAADRSKGNFLYAVKVANDLEDMSESDRRVESLPKGLEGWIRGEWHRLCQVLIRSRDRYPELDEQFALEVLGTIALTRESLTWDQLGSILAPESESRQKAIREVLCLAAEFLALNPRGRNPPAPYRFYHESFSDYVRKLLGKTGERLREGVIAENCMKAIYDPAHALNGYGVRHLIGHLAAAGRQNDAAALLGDFDWLRAKLHSTDIRALITDYDSCRDNDSLQAVLAALKQSSHVLAKDKRQLAPQLIGWLDEEMHGNLSPLLDKAASRQSGIWLRPLKASLARGPLIRTLGSHSNCVRAVVATPDGRLVASGSNDKTVKLWDLESSEEVYCLKGHTDTVTALAVSADSSLLVSGSVDGTLRTWSLRTGEEVRTLQAHPFWVKAVALTAQGRYAVSASANKTLKVWDLQLGKEVYSLVGHQQAVSCVAVDPKGRFAVSGSWDKTIMLWDLTTGKHISTFEGHCDCVSKLVMTSDSHFAISGSNNGTIKMWDIQTAREVCSFGANTGAIEALAIFPDQHHLVSASRRTMIVWDLRRKQIINELDCTPDAVLSAAVLSDGRSVVTGMDDWSVRVWDISKQSSGSILATGHNTVVSTLGVTPDGLHAVSGAHDGTVKVWSMQTGGEVHNFDHRVGGLAVLAIASCGNLVVSNSKKTLKTWSPATGRTRRVLRGHKAFVRAVAATPNGHTVVSGSDDETLRVWDLKTSREVLCLVGHCGCVDSVAVTPDGRLCVSGGLDQKVRVWDIAAGKQLRVFEGHVKQVAAVGITPDGKFAISGSYDTLLKVWNVESGAEVCTLREHTGPVRVLAVSPNGRFAASGAESEDRRLPVWDVANWKVVACFYGEGVLRSCAFAPDGVTIVVGERGGRVHFLRLEG